MKDYDDKWVAECEECCWRFTSRDLSKADLKADEHTTQTGHRVKVDISVD